MLTLKIAHLYADLVINKSAFYGDLGRIRADLAALRSPTITPRLNTAAFFGDARRIRSELADLRRASQARGGGGQGFGAGLASGAGLYGNPGMMAGEMAGRAALGSVAAFADIESQMATIRRVAGLSADETERLKRSLIDISKTKPGVSIDDVLEMATTGGRAGMRGADPIAKFAEDMAMVKNAADDIPTDELAERMLRFLKVFELGEDKIKNFGSALVAMDNESIASIQELLDVSTRLSGTAHAVGMSPQQTVALSSVIKDQGVNSEVGGTAVSQVLQKLGTDRKQFAAMIGMDANELEALYRDSPLKALSKVLRHLHDNADVLDNLDDLKDLKLRGARTGGTLLQMAGGMDKIDPRVATANKEWDGLGALIEANAIKAGTLANEFQLLRNEMTAMGEWIGGGLSPIIRGASGALRGTIEATQDVLGSRTDSMGTANLPDPSKMVKDALAEAEKQKQKADAAARATADAARRGYGPKADTVWGAVSQGLLGRGTLDGIVGGAKGMLGAAGIRGAGAAGNMGNIWDGLKKAAEQQRNPQSLGIHEGAAAFGLNQQTELLNQGAKQDEVAKNTREMAENFKQVLGVMNRLSNMLPMAGRLGP